MKKAVIVYASIHHGSTKKLVDAVSDKYDVALIDALAVKWADISAYDLIGFASGIDFGKFYRCVEEFLQENLPEGKKVFFLYTCARTSPRFTTSVRMEAAKKGAVVLGEYGCRGYNTYGALKLLGGMNKNCPDRGELDGAVEFFASLLEQ